MQERKTDLQSDFQLKAEEILTTKLTKEPLQNKPFENLYCTFISVKSFK